MAMISDDIHNEQFFLDLEILIRSHGVDSQCDTDASTLTQFLGYTLDNLQQLNYHRDRENGHIDYSN